jgi:hypothetical protein
MESAPLTGVDCWSKLNDTLQSFKTSGMQGMSGSVWPVVIRNGGIFGIEEYRYPESFFRNLKWKYKLHLPYDKKSDRLFVLKHLVDQLMNDDINVNMFHLGEYCLYERRRNWTSYAEDFTEKSIGKRRAEFLAQVPRSDFINNDDFLAANWSYLVDCRDIEVGEHRRNPLLSKVRILFTPEMFGDWTGTYYSNADWVEPVSGDYDLGVKKFLAEKDPMSQEPKKAGMIEGHIICLQQLHNGNRHYVNDKPITAGSYIEVRFGDGWIPGRYEWSFNSGDPIRIHAGEEVILIREGHRVRVSE